MTHLTEVLSHSRNNLRLGLEPRLILGLKIVVESLLIKTDKNLHRVIQVQCPTLQISRTKMLVLPTVQRIKTFG